MHRDDAQMLCIPSTLCSVALYQSFVSDYNLRYGAGLCLCCSMSVLSVWIRALLQYQ